VSPERQRPPALPYPGATASPGLENARLDALQLALWDAEMTEASLHHPIKP
jgi:hypothetical protein